MKLFIKKIATFLVLMVLTFVLSFIVISIVGSEKIVNTTNVNIVLGDSNTECAINDGVLDNTINISSSGDSYFYQYLKLKKIVSDNTKIDTLYLSFSPHNVYGNDWLFGKKNKVETTFTHYFALMTIDEKLMFIKNKPKAVVFSVFKSPLRSAKLAANYALNKNYNYGGFSNINRNKLDVAIKKINETFQYKTMAINEVKYLKIIVSFCKANNIPLVFINTPKRNEILAFNNYRVTDFYSFYRTHFSEIPFLDYSGFLLSDDQYGDLTHLNSSGAKYFSKYLNTNGIYNSKYLFQ
ncbi:MAG: hypothetical protein ACPGUH_04995 [Winogradskyella sp.]